MKPAKTIILFLMKPLFWLYELVTGDVEDES